MGVPQTGLPKFKLFNHSRWTHEIFRKGKYDKSFPQTGLSKIQTFKAGHIKWWSTNSQLPHLKQLDSKYLCIPATSASSEWCFSSAGLTMSELKTQLSGEHFEALNVMHCNKALLQLSKSLNKFFLHIGGG